MIFLSTGFLVDLASLISDLVIQYGYPGAFVAGFLGSQYFPSWIVVPIFGRILEPYLVGILAGIGAGIGQFLHYFIGAGGRRLLSTKRKASLDRWRGRLEKYGTTLIFAFAVTPLSLDDLIWIPIGLIGYSWRKSLIAVIAGKVVLNLIYAYAGFFGFPVVEELIGLNLTGWPS